MSSPNIPIIYRHLLNKALISDPTVDYAMPFYDDEAISNAAISVVTSILEEKTIISQTFFTKKKRVKTLIEFFSVTLALPIKHTNLMSVAVRTYEKWCSDLSFFGDQVRQNKFLRRIITQLTLPFGMREITDVELFQKSFYQVLLKIFKIYNYIIDHLGLMLEKETWLTLISSLTGVCDYLTWFDFGANLPRNMHEELLKIGYRTLFTAIITSGIFDKPIFERHIKFCFAWSSSLFYIQVWSEFVSAFFNLINARIYEQELEAEPFRSGVYSKDAMSVKTATFLLYQVNCSIDFKQCINKPEHLLDLYKTINSLITDAILLSEDVSSFQIMKFPVLSFVKLFGGILTFAPILPPEYDSAISVNVNNLLSLCSRSFDTTGAEKLIQHLLMYAINRSNSDHQIVFNTFVKGIVKTLSANPHESPFISNHFLDILEINTPALIDVQFQEALVAGLISTLTITSRDPNKLWHSVWQRSPNIHLPLLCLTTTVDIDIIPKIAALFAPDAIILMNDLYLASVVTFLGGYVRIHPECGSQITELRIIQLLIRSVLNRNSDDIEILIISTIQALIDCLDYCKDIFTSHENLNSIFELVKYVRHLLRRCRDSTGRSSIESANQVRHRHRSLSLELPDVNKRFDRKRRLIESLVMQLSTCVSIHQPSQDYFTRRLDSSSEINEAKLMEVMGGEKVYYYTVGTQILVSFIESNDGHKLAVLARGAFGKSCWICEDRYLRDRPPPMCSDEIEKGEITIEPIKVHDASNLGEEFEHPVTISMENLEQVDEEIRSVFKKDFTTWLTDDWGFYVHPGEECHYQRPRVVDFLTTLGILDAHNKMEVRAQNDPVAIKKVIDDFEKLESPEIETIPIRLVLPGDEKLEDREEFTPSFIQFMKEIGEPMMINGIAVPTIPSSHCLGAIVAPGQGEIPEDCKIQLIFNDSDFDLLITPPKKTTILVIRPMAENGIYEVAQYTTMKRMQSPFTSRQIMSTRNLAFSIGVLIQQIVVFKSSKTLKNVVKQRKLIISELCAENKSSELGPLASTSFEPVEFSK